MTELLASTYVLQPGKGSLFAKADKDTGEIIAINGSLKLTEKYGALVLKLDGTLVEGGGISLIGTIQGHPGSTVSGLLIPKQYDADYKGGEITFGAKKKITIKVNSKTMIDRNGEPYRFLYITTNSVRTAC